MQSCLLWKPLLNKGATESSLHSLFFLFFKLDKQAWWWRNSVFVSK